MRRQGGNDVAILKDFPRRAPSDALAVVAFLVPDATDPNLDLDPIALATVTKAEAGVILGVVFLSIVYGADARVLTLAVVVVKS